MGTAQERSANRGGSTGDDYPCHATAATIIYVLPVGTEDSGGGSIVRH